MMAQKVLMMEESSFMSPGVFGASASARCASQFLSIELRPGSIQFYQNNEQRNRPVHTRRWISQHLPPNSLFSIHPNGDVPLLQVHRTQFRHRHKIPCNLRSRIICTNCLPTNIYCIVHLHRIDCNLYRVRLSHLPRNQGCMYPR